MSIAPPRCSALPVLSTEAVSATLSVEAFPTLSAEAIPTTLSAEAIPTLSTEASPATIPPANDPVLEDIHPQGSSNATGAILCGHAAASYYSPAEENTMFNSIGNSKLIAKIFTSNLDPLNINHDDEHEHVLHMYTLVFALFSALLDIIAFTGASYSFAFIYILFLTLPHIMRHAYGHAAHYGTRTSLLSTFLVFPFTFGQAP